MCTAAQQGSVGKGSQLSDAVGKGLQLSGVVGQAFGAADASSAYKQNDLYQASVADNNATIAGYQAADALARGQIAEQKQRTSTAVRKGSQRASFAARGIALDEGSPLNILSDTDYYGELDALTIRDNAAREAWGDNIKGSNYTSSADVMRARAAAENPSNAFASTLLTAGGTVAASWYKSSQSASSGTG